MVNLFNAKLGCWYALEQMSRDSRVGRRCVTHSVRGSSIFDTWGESLEGRGVVACTHEQGEARAGGRRSETKGKDGKCAAKESSSGRITFSAKARAAAKKKKEGGGDELNAL